MRNMSFSMTTVQMKLNTKTVTRRFGWWFLKPGDIVMAIEKGQGLKKGEKVKRLYPIRILSTRGEPLRAITQPDCVKEGFPKFSPEDFVDMLVKKFKCSPARLVNRIEFERVKAA